MKIQQTLTALTLGIIWCVAGVSGAQAQVGAIAAADSIVTPTGTPPSIQQDSQYLTELTSGVMSPDGLLSVGVNVRFHNTDYLVEDHLARVSQRDLILRVEAGPMTWLRTLVEIPWRSWSQGVGWMPASGSGLGDGRWQLTTGRALVPGRLHLALAGGGNIPWGDKAAGLTEGVFSPQVTGALTMRFWTQSQVPELRLHLNAGYRWNRCEKTGYGHGTDFLEPWFPRYQSADAAGGNAANDYLVLGGAVEFRKGTTSLWVEYLNYGLPGNETVSSRELPSFVNAGLRWGVSEGWAVRAAYQIFLGKDDPQTAWYPAFPDMAMTFGISRQFSIGGRDSDGDGVVDRKDHCPDFPEDLDGYQDEDGCPDPDNDQDGVPDRQDGAPNNPEDFDGWQDEDGVPDPDNDGDGIPDYLDLCPNEAEDKDGHNDDDGCPDVFIDTDSDGIGDDADDCPGLPEDMDGFEDEDGCPEADNDLDGILDKHDACPNEAEDYDGDRDEDGCPDTDEPAETKSAG